MHLMTIRSIPRAALFLLWPIVAWTQAVPERTLHDGVTTRRPVPGAPYELVGKRVVFANWYYIQPGDTQPSPARPTST
jgi:hypothetical protein